MEFGGLIGRLLFIMSSRTNKAGRKARDERERKIMANHYNRKRKSNDDKIGQL